DRWQGELGGGSGSGARNLAIRWGPRCAYRAPGEREKGGGGGGGDPGVSLEGRFRAPTRYWGGPGARCAYPRTQAERGRRLARAVVWAVPGSARPWAFIRPIRGPFFPFFFFLLFLFFFSSFLLLFSSFLLLFFNFYYPFYYFGGRELGFEGFLCLSP